MRVSLMQDAVGLPVVITPNQHELDGFFIKELIYLGLILALKEFDEPSDLLMIRIIQREGPDENQLTHFVKLLVLHNALYLMVPYNPF